MENQEFSLGYAYGISCDMSTKEGKQTWSKLCAIIIGFCAISYALTIPVITYPVMFERVSCFEGLFLNPKEQGYCIPTMKTEIICKKNADNTPIDFYRAVRADLKTITRHATDSYKSGTIDPGKYAYYGLTLGPNSTASFAVETTASNAIFELVNRSSLIAFSENKDYTPIERKEGTSVNFTITSKVLDQYFAVAIQPKNGASGRISFSLIMDYVVYDVSKLTKLCSDKYCSWKDVGTDEIIIADNSGSEDYNLEVDYPPDFNGVSGGIIFGILGVMVVIVLILVIYLASQRAFSCMAPNPDDVERNGLLQNSARS